MTRRGWILLLALALIWGIPYLLIKVAVAELSPPTLVLARTTLGAAVLLPIAIARGGLGALLARWKPLVLFTVLELAIPWVLLSDAERRISSSLAGLLIASVPLVSVLTARLLGGEQPLGARGVAGLLVGVVGVAVLLGIDLRGGDGLAVLEMVLVVVGYATGPYVLTRGLAGLPSLDVVAASLTLCAVAYAPFGIAMAPDRLPSPAALGAVVALGLVCTAVAFLVFFRLIAEVGPVRATVVTYLNPAVATAAGVLLLGEPLTTGILVGFPLILLGSWLGTSHPAPQAQPARGAAAT